MGSSCSLDHNVNIIKRDTKDIISDFQNDHVDGPEVHGSKEDKTASENKSENKGENENSQETRLIKQENPKKKRGLVKRMKMINLPIVVTKEADGIQGNYILVMSLTFLY